jgi:hypothetical protein
MMTPTPTRDDLHELVDRLPESQWSAAQRALQYLHLVTTTPVDDEPWTDEDEAALQEAEEEIARGDIMSHEDARRLLLEP